MRDHVLRLLLATLHRARVRGPQMLAAVALAILAVGTRAFLDEARPPLPPCTWDEALYYTAGLFTFAGNRFGYPHGLVLRVIYFAAPTVSTLSLLGALVHLVEERAPLLLRRFRGHVVVGGLGNLGTTLSRHQRAHGHPVIAIEKDDAAPEVGALRASGEGLVLVGDMTSPQLLRRARAHTASRVFFTSKLDAANLDAAFQLRRLARSKPSGTRPTIYAHVYDAELGESLRPQLAPRQADDAPIVVFNSYRFAAKALLSLLLRDRRTRALRVAPGLLLARDGWPLAAEVRPEPTDLDQAFAEDRARLQHAFSLEADGAVGTDERFALVGLGRFGRAVLRELFDASPQSTRFLVVERSEASFQSGLATFSAAERARAERAHGDAVSPEVLGRIQAFRPDAVLVCTDNDIINLRLALDLRRLKVEVVTRMFDLESSTELGRGLEEQGICPVGLSQLFRAAVPILTHEQNVLACLNLDFNRTPVATDHLFYLAQVNAEQRTRLGRACVSLSELRAAPGCPPPPPDRALVWSREVRLLGREEHDE